MCIICRRVVAQALLARHIMGKDGVLRPDGQERLPGRGWYCCADPVCVARFARFKPGNRRKKLGNAAGG